MIQGQGRGATRLDELLTGGPADGREGEKPGEPSRNSWGRLVREDRGSPPTGVSEAAAVEERILSAAPTNDQPGGHTGVSTQSAARRPAAESAGVRSNPWGRPVAETAAPPRTPQASDFRDVGLTGAQAASAVAGLAEGRFLSFEDACLSAAIFGARRGAAVKLDEAAMRSKARTFLRPS